MKRHLFQLKVKPEPQKRVRVYNRIAIDPSKEYKNFLKMQLIEQYQGELITAPIEVAIYFKMPVPKSTSKKKTEQMLRQQIKHTKKPDIDNLAKAVLDALNKTIIKDDGQIYTLCIRKIYDNEQGIIIDIIEDEHAS